MTNTLSTTVELLHIGGPTVRLNYGGLVWLTDPTFDDPGDYSAGALTLHKLTGPAIAADRVGPVDVVLLSHDQHPDNLDPAGREVMAGVETVLSTPEAAGRLEGVRGLTVWESVRIGAVTVTAVPALHGPEGAEALSGTVTGFVLQAEEKNVRSGTSSPRIARSDLAAAAYVSCRAASSSIAMSATMNRSPWNSATALRTVSLAAPFSSC